MFSKKNKVAVCFAIVFGAIFFISLMEYRKFYLVSVSEKASYINKSIAPVYQWKSNKEDLLIYYLPDIHATTVHKEHFRSINFLKDKFGIGLVGIEGNEGKITKKDLEDELRAVIEAEARGEISQLAKVDVKIFGGEVKKIQSMHDLLEVYPLYNFVENEQYPELVGVDSYIFLNLLLKEHEKLTSFLEKHEYEFSRAQAFRSTALIDRPELDKDQEFHRLYQKLTDEYEKGKRAYTEALVKLDNIIETKKLSTLKGRMEKYDRKALNVIRGKEAVAVLSLEMAKRNIKQAVLVFGQAHYSEIVEECNTRGISFIIIGHRNEVREADKKYMGKFQEKVDDITKSLKDVSKMLDEARKEAVDIKEIENLQSPKLIIPDEIWREELKSQEALKK